MTVVKNLAFVDKNKLKNLSSFIASELDISTFYPFYISFLHHILPFKFKFLEETFVAIENKKIKGLITINKAGEKRVKISRLLLEENSEEIGKMLTNCVVTLFLSKGAENFYVVVDKNNIPLLTMFKNGLNFKDYGKEIIYQIKNDRKTFEFEDINFEHIYKMKKNYSKKVEELINGMMLSYRKPTFLKNAKEINNAMNFNKEHYIVYDKNNDNILGYFFINKMNKNDFLLEFVINSGYEAYSSDIIKYAKSKLIKNKNFKNLYIKLKSYYQNFDELYEMFNMEYERINECEILVKDFLIQKKQEFTFEKLIFNDATPAF